MNNNSIFSGNIEKCTFILLLSGFWVGADGTFSVIWRKWNQMGRGLNLLEVVLAVIMNVFSLCVLIVFILYFFFFKRI